MAPSRTTCMSQKNTAIASLGAKTKMKRLPEKHNYKDWFLGVYKEASIFKEQQKLN